MTALTANKRVRVENADLSTPSVKVTAQVLNRDGAWVDEPHHQLLALPTAQTEFFLSPERRLIVEVA